MNSCHVFLYKHVKTCEPLMKCSILEAKRKLQDAKNKRLLSWDWDLLMLMIVLIAGDTAVVHLLNCVQLFATLPVSPQNQTGH